VLGVLTPHVECLAERLKSFLIAPERRQDLAEMSENRAVTPTSQLDGSSQPPLGFVESPESKLDPPEGVQECGILRVCRHGELHEFTGPLKLNIRIGIHVTEVVRRVGVVRVLLEQTFEDGCRLVKPTRPLEGRGLRKDEALIRPENSDGESALLGDVVPPLGRLEHLDSKHSIGDRIALEQRLQEAPCRLISDLKAELGLHRHRDTPGFRVETRLQAK